MKAVRNYESVRYATGNYRRQILLGLVLCLSAAFPFAILGLTASAQERQLGGSEVLASADGAIGSTFLEETESPRTVSTTHSADVSVPPGIIVVDGDPGEWIAAGIEPLIVDPTGDHAPPGLDTLSLRVTDDGLNVYFLFEFAGRPVNSSYLLLDIDIDQGTGCEESGVGIEYGVTFLPSSIASSFIGDARDCTWSSSDFPAALTPAVGGSFIEASVSIATLKVLNPTLAAFDITCSNDKCNVARYVICGPPSWRPTLRWAPIQTPCPPTPLPRTLGQRGDQELAPEKYQEAGVDPDLPF